MSTDPKQNVGTRVKAQPLDDNQRALAGMLVPIVEAGEIVGYLPVKGIDNLDGTATLASTVNVTLDADVDIGNIHLLNIANAKIDPATEQKQDDIITAIGGISSVDPVGLKNIAAATINPATEDTLATRASEATLALLEAKDFATQTTLALVATEATLAAIKLQTDKLIFTGNDLNVIDSAVSTAGVAEHHNGTATTTPATVAFSGTSKALLVDNLDASKNLLVSFDSGVNTKTVLPGQSLSIEANHSSVDVSASAGTVAFEMLVTV